MSTSAPTVQFTSSQLEIYSFFKEANSITNNSSDNVLLLKSGEQPCKPQDYNLQILHGAKDATILILQLSNKTQLHNSD
jgi:hypothetical protein